MCNEKKEDLGFTYNVNKQGEITINRYGKKVTILRNRKAAEFIEEIDFMENNEQQQYMARLTGNYKRGNEKLAKKHFRNRQ